MVAVGLSSIFASFSIGRGVRIFVVVPLCLLSCADNLRCNFWGESERKGGTEEEEDDDDKEDEEEQAEED